MVSKEVLKAEIVKRLARKNVVGSHKKQVDTVKNWFPSHQQGEVEELVREMIRDPNAPLEGYGGARDNVRISDMEDAKQFIRERGIDLPWQLRD